MAGLTWKGWAKDDDPRYKGGSRLMTGANLNPAFVKKALVPAASAPQKTSLAEKIYGKGKR